MKNFFKTKLRYLKFSTFIMAIAFFMLIFIPSFFTGKTIASANIMPRAEETPTLPDIDEPPILPDTDQDESYIDYTVFIKNATYSTIYNNKIYVIDKNSDEEIVNYTLKSFDLSSSEFEQIYMILDNIENIIDVAYIEGHFMVLADNGIFNITLDSDKIANETACTELDLTSANINSSDYSGISTFNYINTTSATNEYFILLTPKAQIDAESTTESPKIIIYDNDFTYKKIVSVDIKNETESSLFKLFAIGGKTEELINLVFVYENEVYYFRTDRDSFNSSSGSLSTGSSNKFTVTFETTSDRILKTVNTISINNKTYVLATFEEPLENETTNSFGKLYEITISNIDNDGSTYFTFKHDFKMDSQSDYAITSNNYFIYSSGQEVKYVELNINDSTFNPIYNKITNPKITIDYFEEDSFIYSRTIENCKILPAPWTPINSDGVAEIQEKIDVIIIGRAYITSSGEKLYIKDYNYCLYTVNDINYVGFIESKNLTEKSLIDIENPIKYTKILKAKPNAALYSLPTKVLGDQITSELSSELVQLIKDNSRIEFLNNLYYYESNNSIFLKVKVNDQAIGYIEFDSLISPSDLNNYVLTNSYIKQNNTKVYLEENENSPVIYLLETDKRIRINGTRNTKTGFTYITFNDEFGNEFSGYIKNENIKSDHWSTLQIIGCVLIAINIGLLILIVYFKDKKIGMHGQKYTKNKKSN